MGKGEREAIDLAYYLKKSSVIVLLDDRAGRTACKQLKLLYTGTIGVLLRAKEKGIIPNVTSQLQLMREKGYWYSDTIINLVKRRCGED